MLMDAQEFFSDEQALTSDAISTYVIDLMPTAGGAIGAGATGGPGTNTVATVGSGKPMYLYILVTTALDTAGEAGTLDVTLESDDDTNLSSSPTVHMTLTQVAEATLAAGYWIAQGVPIPPGNYQRYLGLRYNVNNSDAFTSGKVSAWLSDVPAAEGRQFATGRTTGIN